MSDKRESAAWKKEIYRIIETIDKPVFTLVDLYSFETELRRKFPSNRHIKEKIRQQLQFIRDNGFLEFVDNRGVYRKLYDSKEEKRLLREVKLQVGSNNFELDDKWSLIKRRVGIRYFRTLVLRNFEYRCCICEFDIEPLLDAAHIIPWNEDTKNRLNPSNGLAFCRIHHGAFDIGLLSIGSGLVAQVSETIRMSTNNAVKSMLAKYHGRKILRPKEFELLL